MAVVTEPAVAVTARPATRRDEAILLAATAVLVGGLFTDAFMHVNQSGGLESFVTPWHAVVFLGFALTAGWVLLLLQDRRVPGRRLRTAVPPGYDLAVLGLVAFFLGFNGDAIWHTVFGIESDTDALLSPPHLVMGAALLAIVSTPYRTRAGTAAPSWRSDGTRVVSLLLTTMMVAFFLLYLWTPAFSLGSVAWQEATAAAGGPPFLRYINQIAMLSSAFMVTAVVLVPVLLIARGARPPLGAVALLAGFPAVAIAGVRGFSNRTSLLAFVVAAVLAEALVASRGSERRRLLLLGTLLPLALWSVYWGVFAVVRDLAWEIEIYTGQVVSSVLAGVCLATLVAGPRRAQAVPSPDRTSR